MINREIIEVDGFKFYCRDNKSDKKAIKDNIQKKSYEKFFPILPGENWIDIGGYIGTFTIRAKKLGAKTFSFEPDLDNYTVFLENLKLNDIFDCIVENKAILEDCKGSKKVDLFMGTKKNPWSHSIVHRWKRQHPSISVPCLDFKSALKLARKHFNSKEVCIKIDAEGIESDILENLKDKEIKKIVFEYHFLMNPSRSRFESIINKLQNMGYNVDLNQKLPKGEVSDWPWMKTVILGYAIKK